MKTLGFFLFLFAMPALADNYVVVCSAPCVASDGTTQPAGTVLNRIVWDGKSPYSVPNAVLQADAGQAIYTPAPIIQPTIPALAFIQRFTSAEQAALTTANPVWGISIAAAGTITVTNPLLIADMQAAVSAGLLTSARMTQILNLAVPSP